MTSFKANIWTLVPALAISIAALAVLGYTGSFLIDGIASTLRNYRELAVFPEAQVAEARGAFRMALIAESFGAVIWIVIFIRVVRLLIRDLRSWRNAEGKLREIPPRKKLF